MLLGYMRPLLLSVVIGMLCLSCSSKNMDQEKTNKNKISELSADSVADSLETKPVLHVDDYGFRFDSSKVSDYKVQRNESLYLILDKFDFSAQQIYAVTQKANELIDLDSFKPGQPYRAYASAGGEVPLTRLVWQPNPVDYVVFDWRDSLQVYKSSKIISSEIATASGKIQSSLYETMMKEDLSPLLAYKLSNIYAWEIDFFSLRSGDSFRMVYEKQYIDGEFYEIGEIKAVEFVHRGEVFPAYRFDDASISGFFDAEGNSVQKALLKAPFTYNQRISSGFSRNRFHPVLKRRMPHYGVDYAAPHGTPVLSVGDGTVTEARYRGANGNIVKIRHNGTYETAYLHLSGFGKGIRRGASVKQGEIIGYVGRTGRVTGTHLDYRIYKDGRPVNPLTVDLPSSESIPDSSLVAFKEVRDRYRKMFPNPEFADSSSMLSGPAELPITEEK